MQESNKRKENEKQKRKTLRSVLKVAFSVFCVAIVLAAALGIYVVHQIKNSDNELDPILKKGIQSLADSSEAMQYARELKSDYQLLGDALRMQDVQKATEIRTKIDTDIQDLENYLDKPFWKAAENIGAVEEEISSARELLDLVQTANTTLIDPLIEQLMDYPLTTLKTADGFHVDVVTSYLDFLESIFPVLKDFSERLNSSDLRILKIIDTNGKVEDYSTRLTQVTNDYESCSDYVPILRTVLGGGGDRLYVFAAQNTAEIRASGGFPGSVGAIRIQNGILSIVEFQSVYNVFSNYVPYEAEITSTETYLFQGRMDLPWDSDFSPDFERAAYIWALAYQNRNGEHVDGVISATPVVIQRLLTFLGEITLSDGTVLNGENAMRVIEHDLYFEYLSLHSETPYWTGRELTDQLFAETARETLNLLLSSMSLDNFRNLMTFARESFADRTLMLWLADPDEQEMVRQIGWAGTLNQDETEPAVGVFFNSTSASKMGWYLDIDISIGEGIENEDGSMTYPVSVSYSNVLTSEERDIAGGYILGGGHGGLAGGMYIFAPAGGTISNYQTSNGNLNTASYQGLALIYQYDTIGMESSVVIECEVTTAPEASCPLEIIQTPTAQGFR